MNDTFSQTTPHPSDNNFPGRHNLQLGRRLLHLSIGVIMATLYGIFLEHSHAVSLLGTLVGLFYIFEQVRLNYPEYAEKLSPLTRLLYRAEEQLKESSAIPYLVSSLLTILIFPKVIAIAAILTLAIADPASAIIGIKFGRKRIVPHKSLEGSSAFFLACLLCIYLSFKIAPQRTEQDEIFFFAITSAFFSSLAEMLPIKLDDNITIPLSSAIIMSILSVVFGLQII